LKGVSNKVKLERNMATLGGKEGAEVKKRNERRLDSGVDGVQWTEGGAGMHLHWQRKNGGHQKGKICDEKN